jgi:cytochrome c oxidase assembly protein subunit 15
MRVPHLTPATYHRLTLVTLFALAFIVVTGGAVRLTGSGLGCPDWPTCANGHVVAPLQYNALVEFINRTITGIVSVAVILAVLGSLVRTPRRRDLVILSLGLVAGVIGQIILGGLVVLFDLYPPLVMGHFLLSMLIVWNAVVLHRRAGLTDDAVTVPAVDHDQLLLGRLVVAFAGLVIVLGTVVTASGPHPGSNGDQVVERLPFALHRVAQLHGTAVVLFLALVLATTWTLWRAGGHVIALRRAEVLLGVIVAQAAVGYVQYFTRLPVLLVGIHIAGATALWIAALRFELSLFSVASRSWTMAA